MRFTIWVSLLLVFIVATSCGGLREHIRERQEATHGPKRGARDPRPKDSLCRNDAKTNNPDKLKGVSYYENKWQVKLSGKEDEDFLSEVDSWLGVPYVYGGKSKQGTDCSGMIQTMYKQRYGLSLERSASDMQKDVDFINVDKANFGDILFFKINFKTVGHVAFYLGQKRFIHATTSRGVIISSLDEEYYEKRFYKAGRLKKKPW